MTDTALRWTTAPPCPDTIARIAGSTEPGTHAALERVAAWERAIAWMQAQQAAELAALVAEAETCPPPGWSVADSVESTIAEIGLILHVTTNTAARRAHHARDLLERFPATYSLLHAGDLTAVKARILVEECADLSEADAARVEAAVLPRAPEQTPGRLREAIRRAIARVDADAAARRRARRTRERKVVLYPERDGMAAIVATLPAAEAVGVFAVLDEHARRAGSADPRPMDARRADVLTDIVLGGAGFRSAGSSAGSMVESPPASSPLDRSAVAELFWAGSAPAAGGPPCTCGGTGTPGVQVQVRVTVPLDTLLGASNEPGDLAGYGPLPPDQARALAFTPDSVWYRLITDPVTGALLDHGATRYRPPPALAEHLYARHGTCQFPGCRTPAHRCDLDHNIPFAEGGPTSSANVGPKCRPHHRLKGLPGWEVLQYPDGTIDWTTPSGHTYRVDPPAVAPVHPARLDDHEPAPF